MRSGIRFEEFRGKRCLYFDLNKEATNRPRAVHFGSGETPSSAVVWGSSSYIRDHCAEAAEGRKEGVSGVTVLFYLVSRHIVLFFKCVTVTVT